MAAVAAMLATPTPQVPEGLVSGPASRSWRSLLGTTITTRFRQQALQVLLQAVREAMEPTLPSDLMIMV